MLLSLARVLRLSDQERAHPFRVPDQAEPADGQIKRRIGPSVQRILDRLTSTPVMVVDASWQCISANPLAYALGGDPSALPSRARNLAWTVFTGAPSRYLRTEEEEHSVRLEVVAELWEQRPGPQPGSRSRTFLHPEIGSITLDSDFLTDRDSDLRLIVFTAAPGTEAAAQLELLGNHKN